MSPEASQLLAQLARVFGYGLETTVAEKLIAFLSSHRETSYINLQLVRQIAPGAQDLAILRALQYLSGDEVQLLDTRYEIVDSEQHPHDLSPDEVRVALAENIDPLTGQYDPMITDRLCVYYSPTGRMHSISGAASPGN